MTQATTFRPDYDALKTATGERISHVLAAIRDHVEFARRIVHAGDTVYEAGDRLEHLFVIHSGIFKTVNLTPDGREQVVGLHFKGDWMGFDGIADGRFGCDAVAMDTGEVWMIRYDALLAACARTPSLMGIVHCAMSREITRDRESMMSLCTLPADARVADFLRYWADALESRGLRSDQITLRMTRAEIGNYLGMKLETVSRSLARLAREKLIGFSDGGRRAVRIPDVGALCNFVQSRLESETATLQ